MNINISNYGAWFLDYYEGALTAEKTAELFLFLSQHPELKDEFESFSLITLSEPVSESFPGKEKLKKGLISPANIDEFLIADMEGDLNLQEKVKLKDFIKRHPEFEKDKSLYSLAKLIPGDEVYPDKRSLKIRIVRPVYQTLRFVAAAAIIVLMLGVLYINEKDKSTNQTAENDSVAVQTVPPVQQAENDADVKNDIPSSPVETVKKDLQFAEEKSAESDKKPVTEYPLHAQKHSATSDKERGMAEPLQLAGRIEVNAVEQEEATFEIATVEKKSLKANLALPVSDEFAEKTKERKGVNGKLDELKDKAAEKVNAVTGEEILYTQDELADASTSKIPFKSRVVKFVAWTVAKISGDKVIMEPTFDASGNIAAYQVSAGKFKYERDF